ncbi:MAG TPA: hemolysin family protein, partial [Ruminiclostridium sp.]|nr:hemolysin family protein [Ruminiclostridium sp.]
VLQLILLVLLISINAFFAASEMAIITANDTKIKRLADDGNKRAILLEKLLSKPSNFLAAIQVGVTMSSLFSSAVASESLADRITLAFRGSSISPSVVKIVSVVIITILLSYFTLVFGELVPKRVAMKNSEALALRVVGILNGISVAFLPFVELLSHSTNAVAHIFGVSPNDSQNNVTEEEIRMMVDVGEETGAIDESEKEMINNIFEFNDRTASDIMTHRTEIYAVENTASLTDIVNVAMNEGFSRIPVFKDDLDDIVGIVFAKDMLKFVGMTVDRHIDISDIMRPPLFVPKTKRCQDLFVELTEQKQHMAVVIDEYGGTAGIVTMEDLLESIVGSIQDEYDDESDDYSVIDDSTYTVEGTTDIEEVERLLDTELPEGEYDTLAGLIIDRLGRIPSETEHPTVEIGDFIFTVEHVEEKRIEKVRVEKKKNIIQENK